MPDTSVFHLYNFLKKKTTVVISEYAELLTSLHVLHRPDHHPYRVNWAKELQGKLPSSLQARLQEMGELSYEWLALFDVEIGTEPKPSFENLIAKLNSLPDAEFLLVLFNQRFSLEQIIRWMKGMDEAEFNKMLNEREKQALHRPSWTKRQMTEALYEYYEQFFQEEWKTIEPWLVRAERIFYEELEINPIDAIETLHPRIFVKDDGLYAQKVTLYRLPYGEIKSIKVRPSTFVYPHLLLGWTNGIASLPLSVETPDATKVDEVPVDLVRMFKVMSDPTRLKIIRSLYLQPHCTQQLAHIHHVTEAAVSKHLKLLMEANYVTTERRGNYIFYSLKPNEVEMILVYLRQYLEQ